jgi:PAS domain S-box-containing protein
LDPLTFLLQAAFYGLFAVSLWHWARRRGPLEAAVVLVFAPLAALFALSILNGLAPAVAPVLRPALILILFLQPWFVVRLVDQIRPVAPRVPLIVFLGGVLCALAVLLFTAVPLVTLAAVVFFFAIQAAAAGRLIRDSRRRIGVARVRLAVASVATALFGLAILVSGIASAASGGASVAAAQILTRTMALLAGIGYLCAFVPPDWLRRLAYRALAFDNVRNLVSPEPGVEVGRLWADLASFARELLGARRVTILSEPDGLPLASAGVPQDAIEPVGQMAAAPGSILGRLGQALASKSAIVSRVEVVLRDDVSSRGPAASKEHLVAEVEGRPLFVEDDVALLSMLGNLTARAVDREEALITLGQARHAIAESAAIKASESRFRALLEADPNATLALDEHQSVVWATRQAAELFGAKSESLVGRALSDLVAVPHDAREAGQTGRPVFRSDTTGRRLDGTHFPAEIALTSVEMDGRPFELAVVSDVSWRQEAAQIRDRFLGVLSHELRTPVTSIYGGTQLLLGRGSRLDEATRTELLVSVAAESERLQRMIENLVALARIERGAEFAPGRPVLIDRVIGDLIRRERPLWPEVTIRLTIPAPVQMVSADEEYLGQVVRNLLSNAAKYSGEGAIVDVDVVDADGEVHVRIKDNGPGIADAESDKLFSLYYRAAHQAATAPGAGIGLFICKELVSIMGGRMWARSRPEGGAEFGFSLPAYVEEPEPAWDAPQPAAKPATPIAVTLLGTTEVGVTDAGVENVPAGSAAARRPQAAAG